MKTDKEKEIDNIFKKGLGDPGDNHEHMDADWEAMEQMLDDRKKRPFIIYWLPILSGVAAMLLLLIGWWLMKPAVNHQENKHLVVSNHKLDINHTKTPSTIASNHVNDTLTPNAIKSPGLALVDNQHVPRFVNRSNTSKNQTINNSTEKIKGNEPAVIGYAIKQSENEQLAAHSQSVIIGGAQFDDQVINPVDLTQPIIGAVHGVSPTPKITKNNAYAYRPHFAISVLASSDKNGINSFQQSKPGNNAGVLFSLGISGKLTITTGAIYSAKQYMTNFSDYHTDYQFPTNPVSVLADCKMFDIPLNIDYQVYNKHRNKISIGTGFSSYLMLHENYRFNYAQDATGPAKYNVPNPDKYLFSIANVQATYTRQISSQVGLTLQPYIKLPLSAVGASEVRLQSTGVALGLTWNLSYVSRP